MEKRRARGVSCLLLSSFLSTLSFQSVAAGFALIEQSASGMGKAFAGMAASTEDASSMFFNPATIGFLPGQSSTVAGHYISPSSKFTNKGSVLADGVTPLEGGDGGDAGVAAFVPNAYYKTEINNKVAFGVALNVPFGLATSYEPGWVGRNHAQLSDLATIAISPTIALRSSNRFVYGASINFQYAEALLTNRIDYSSICCGQNKDQQLDGSVELVGDDFGMGFTLGGLINLQHTLIGVSYRSGISHELEGSAEFVIPQTVATQLDKNITYSEKATAELNLPEIISLSVERRISPELKIMGDVSLTKWTSFEALVIDFDNPEQPDTEQPENWENSMRYSIGGVYRLSGKTVLRGGLAYDETPIASPDFRTPRIAGNDRTWLALGVGHRLNNTMSIDVGYAHLFINSAEINNKEELTSSVLKGNYESSVDIFSAQLNMRY